MLSFLCYFYCLTCPCLSCLRTIEACPAYTACPAILTAQPAPLFLIQVKPQSVQSVLLLLPVQFQTIKSALVGLPVQLSRPSVCARLLLPVQLSTQCVQLYVLTQPVLPVVPSSVACPVPDKPLLCVMSSFLDIQYAGLLYSSPDNQICLSCMLPV